MTPSRRAGESRLFVIQLAARGRVAATAGAFLVSLWVTACTQPESGSEVDQESVAADSVEAVDSSSSTAVQQRRVSTRPYVSSFPHEVHREIECATCHGTVPNHRTHGMVRCTDCHEVPQGFTGMRSLTRDECLECHHVRQERRTCPECHTGVDSNRVRTVTATITLTTGTPSPTRDLPFRHERHADLACTSCHTRSVLATLDVTCASCHERHHVPEADCSGCHPSVPQEPHAGLTHTGCGGTGCHADPVVTALPPGRSLCLVCHTAQRSHEPDGNCAECHGIRTWAGHPWPAGAGGASP
jgi:Class III cytochrome C family